MRLNRIAASAAIAGALTSGALGVGVGFAQADPNGPNPGPNVPGPNVPGPNVPDRDGPGQGQWIPGQPICNGGPGVNCNGPGTPLPPGQRGFPPPGHFNDPIGYGYPPRWTPPGQPGDYPVVFNPDAHQWGVFLPGGQFVAYAT
ncbi:hypothetical protein [Mycobacterium sp. E2479]|uniref:hypothetical protein n=1 Tax=Mycobacterium sp. E2479 TaxID=1834134 RepID=UPI000A60CAE1|nr:hypothetical protein [Mycobacterium sp. E2479]